MKRFALGLALFGLWVSSLTQGDLSLAQSNPITVGILHSLSGTMAISEVSVANATELALEEINQSGGVLGQQIIIVKEDGASNWNRYAEKTKKLISTDKVSAIFGGWTSASRKAMLPIIEKNQSLLFYPVQFEGNECSPNIIYSGAQPNQQALPALTWALEQGYKRIYLLGSDYVYPRTVNKILKRHIAQKAAILVGEDYLPLGSTNFSPIIKKIQSSRPQIIINTINGDSNIAFFRAYRNAGIDPRLIPTISFSIAETELRTIGANLLFGHYAAWNYFQSLENPANRLFIENYRQRFGANSVVSDPMVHAYTNAFFWRRAVEKAKSFDPALVRQALVGLEFRDSPLGRIRIEANGSVKQRVYIGRVERSGQFQVVWRTNTEVIPQPYDPLTFPGQSCPKK
jgi:urea transport system substrate-binding protein